jgi:RNA polymerase sigma-70 factor (ECF subfamily)
MTPEEQPTARPAGAPLFPATVWTAVVDAREADTPNALRALEGLACAYWRPLYVFLRQRGRTHDAAEEEVQGFFAHLLSRDFLRFVTPREGRFRTFLLSSFTRWLNDQSDRARAAKRGGGRTLISIEEFASVREIPQPQSDTPERAFDRRWAQEVFERAMAGVAAAWCDRAPLLAALRPMLSGEKLAEEYAAIAARLGTSEGAVRKAAFDLRALFARKIREEIRMTVRDDSGVDEELRYLIQLLRQ